MPTATSPGAATPPAASRHLLLPTLHAVQARVGWISPGALGYVCRRLTIPPAEAYGVASFYALFALEPRPPVVAHVCTDIGCMCRGSDELVAELERTVGPAGEHPGNGQAIWLESPCLGLCERAPAVLLTEAGEDPSERSIAPATAADVAAALAGKLPERMVPEPVAQQGSPDLRLMRRFGVVDPESLDSYRSHGGYEALRRAFALGPMGVIREVSDSRLLGRGGAAFPTGRKWEAVARQPVRPHYLICNADESEPGTFKDRIVFEHDPFSVIEAMTIAAFATGSEHGYVYLRGEYPLAWERLVNAVTVARRHGFLGDDIMGQGMRFDIELRKGAGAYICGEETALFNSIEGFRGEPRNKPPFPVDAGLFQKPTVINNVETLVNVLDIVLEGGRAFAERGTESSTGMRLFCLSGCVERPGLYEAPFGITLREVIDAGGRRQRRARAAGGAARRRGRRVRRPRHARPRALVRGHPGGGRHPRLGRDHGLRRDRPARAGAAAHRRLLPRRVVRPVRPLPGRHGAPAGGPPAAGERPPARLGRRRDRAARRDRPRHARRVDLRPGPDGRERHRVGHPGAPPVRSGGGGMSAVPVTLRRSVELEIDGEAVRAREGETILDACRRSGLDIPTLCFGETLTPVNACRVCMVEVEGSRVLVPSCARKVEDGMKIKTASERVNHARKMVLEFLGSSVDLSTTPRAGEWMGEYGARPERYGPPAPPAEAGERDHAQAGHHHPGDGQTAATVAQPVKVDNELYVRDYAKCILCYKCVEGCGSDWQNTFAIAVAGRGFDARIATEFAVPLPGSACVYCGNCIAVCPTGALMFKSEHDHRGAGTWNESEQTQTDTICPYCGVGCNLTLHVQDNTIVKVTSPLDHDVTSGNLCIKGRFGFQHVQSRK